MKITEEWLKKHHACNFGIKFFKTNKLEGIDSKNVLEAEGDFRGFKLWLKQILDGTCEYDDRGNMVSYSLINDGKHTYEYDEKDNLIVEIDKLDHKTEHSYDSKGNRIKSKEYHGNNTIYTFDYDKNNNKIREVCNIGDSFTNTYEYDENNNLICKFYSGGGKRIFTYDENNNCTNTIQGKELSFERSDNYLKITDGSKYLLTLKLKG